MKIKNLVGQRYGRLLVVEQADDRVEKNRAKRTMWKCVCDCGNEVIVRSDVLTGGYSKSCGCLSREIHSAQLKRNATKHGCSHDRLFTIWCGMRSRCRTKTHSSYHNYGGRGIKVCNEWLDYETFKKWAYENGYDEMAPHGLCTLDRIDTGGDYCPENCRWVDNKTQCNNTRRNHLVTINGETKTFRAWAEEIGIKPTTVYGRISRGMQIEQAFLEPVRK